MAPFLLVVVATSSLAAAGQEMAPAVEPTVHVYAAVDGVELKAYVFMPNETTPRRPRAAIVLFHGGGWVMGEAAWAFPRARRFAEDGAVAVAVQYRLSDQKAVTPLEAMDDARAAIRWVRDQVDSLNIDPRRVAAYGWSAGAHLATMAAIHQPAGGEISSSPDALVLVSPAVSLEFDRWPQTLLGQRANVRDISPDQHVRAGLPPTLILQGDIDTVTPLSGAKRFCDRLREAGNVCELNVYEGFGHLFTPRGIPDHGMPQPDSGTSADAAARADRFLRSLGFLHDQPQATVEDAKD